MGRIKAFFQDLLDKYDGDYHKATAEFESITQETESLIDEVIEAQLDTDLQNKAHALRKGWDVDVDEDGPYIVSES